MQQREEEQESLLDDLVQVLLIPLVDVSNRRMQRPDQREQSNQK